MPSLSHAVMIRLTVNSVAHVASELLSRSRYDEWLKSRYDGKGEYDDRARNVGELLNAIAEFSRFHQALQPANAARITGFGTDDLPACFQRFDQKLRQLIALNKQAFDRTIQTVSVS